MSAETDALATWIIYAAFFFPLVLSVALITFVVYFVRRKHKTELDRKNMLLKQQALVIEKQNAIQHERNRIAAEMHDDLGSGLTRIKYLSERALRSSHNAAEAEQVRSIARQSNQLVTNMSEIIWAMNSRFDNAESLTGYMRRYASEYLDEHQIELTFHAQDAGQNAQITAEKRRNVFLVIKEILHNTVKHSGSHSVHFEIKAKADSLDIAVIEKDAVGFIPEQTIDNGNGIYNMQRRMQTIDGSIEFARVGSDMHIRLRVPLGEAVT